MLAMHASQLLAPGDGDHKGAVAGQKDSQEQGKSIQAKGDECLARFVVRAVGKDQAVGA